DPSPLMLGFILGPMLEENFRRTMLLSRGSFEVFISRPISGTLIGLIAVFVLWQVVSFFRQRGKAPALADAPHADHQAVAPGTPAVPQHSA
ncbi:MAG: tripartite tricarboxylate transporter permease, partial [Acidovorax sp.]|nr:tripartite tricarboxylate transporter permease [Acidovorax sp.]